MAEKDVYFECEDIKLQGLLEERDGTKAVVMGHPHSLYGGNMHNGVVRAVIHAYGDEGYTTLRFNFRGVEMSGGTYGEGVAEQKDVKAALEYVSRLGKTDIDLGGYSFGAWVCAHGLENFKEARRLIMVSPPVSAMDMRFLSYSPKIKLVIAGSLDEIGDYETIQDMMTKWNPEARMRLIHGADHFYGGKTGEIKRIVEEFLDSPE